MPRVSRPVISSKYKSDSRVAEPRYTETPVECKVISTLNGLGYGYLMNRPKGSNVPLRDSISANMDRFHQTTRNINVRRKGLRPSWLSVTSQAHNTLAENKEIDPIECFSMIGKLTEQAYRASEYSVNEDFDTVKSIYSNMIFDDLQPTRLGRELAMCASLLVRDRCVASLDNLVDVAFEISELAEDTSRRMGSISLNTLHSASQKHEMLEEYIYKRNSLNDKLQALHTQIQEAYQRIAQLDKKPDGALTMISTLQQRLITVNELTNENIKTHVVQQIAKFVRDPFQGCSVGTRIPSVTTQEAVAIANVYHACGMYPRESPAILPSTLIEDHQASEAVEAFFEDNHGRAIIIDNMDSIANISGSPTLEVLAKKASSSALNNRLILVGHTPDIEAKLIDATHVCACLMEN